MSVMFSIAEPTSTWYLVLSAVLFGIGTIGVMVRRNPLIMFMCIELMLNAVNLSFVALSSQIANIDGQVLVLCSVHSKITCTLLPFFAIVLLF